MTKKRIIGIDVARALAVIGMIIVNFKMVFGAEGNSALSNILSLFDGKAAATFVVLAGVGIAQMFKASLSDKNEAKLKTVKKALSKRAILLFILGLSYIVIWPADILHFYWVYMIVLLLLIKLTKRQLFLIALGIIFLYPLMMTFFSYDIGWNFKTMTYEGFWSLGGFIRNLFYNGFHPVLPWLAYIILGYWLGGLDLSNKVLMKKVLFVSLSSFILIQILSYGTIQILSDGNLEAVESLSQILGNSPMPPLPFYMLSGSSIAIAVIVFCILISEKFCDSTIINVLQKTGQLALTFYIAHVVIGMGVVEVFGSKTFGNYTIVFATTYALLFSLGCMFFAVIWMKYYKVGPVEYFFKKVGG